jgi:hypothetical protein
MTTQVKLLLSRAWHKLVGKMRVGTYEEKEGWNMWGNKGVGTCGEKYVAKRWKQEGWNMRMT